MSRKIRFQYHLLRGGAFYAYLRADKSQSPKITMSDAGEIKTAFTGAFAEKAVDADGRSVEIDWLSDEIQPVMVIDGVKHPLGVFAVSTPRNRNKMKSTRVSVQAYDHCWRVRETKKGTPIYFASGTAYITAIKQLLAAAGIETIFETPCNDTLANDREWSIGTSFLAVVNELLKEINYKELYFDSNGCAVLEPVSVPEASAIKHIFDANDPTTLVLPKIEREPDYFSAPNVFVVYCSNPDRGAVMTATARNENPQSPLSVQRRGREIVQVTGVNNIASQTALQGHANWLRDKSMISGEKIKIETGLRPGFGVQDAVGVVYGGLTTIGIEHGYTMTLAVGGTMVHTIERAVYNLDA